MNQGEDGGATWHGTAKGWNYQSALDILEKNDSNAASKVPRMDVASIIAAKRKNLKGEKDAEKNKSTKEEESDPDLNSEEESEDEGSSDDDDDEVDDADVEMEGDALKMRSGLDDTEQDDHGNEDEDEAVKAASYFETKDEDAGDQIEIFSQLPLSRPLLRGVAAMGFVKPTPIQASVIPVALGGRDVCASAVTGSGKTAAFLLPILERLFQRKVGGTKALILAPTRELAAQCIGMISTLAQFTKIRACLIVGGAKNVNAQAAELRTRPDIVVATPGRLLDHVTNSNGVSLDDIEFLILDEADRLLDLGFQDEVHEIIKACPVERQTMLFSATMTTKIDDLIKLSLKRPVRIKASNRQTDSDNVEVAERLEQEFVRIRAGNEGINREGMLLALLTRTFVTRTIVFFDTKIKAHRLMILCGLCGIKCAELHGNLTQTQRLQALEDFRKGEVDVLLCTDLAARGLDIDRVEFVVNFEMPNQVETYVHRIGRTARAGRGGKACTLIGEGRRHLMKDVIKDAEQKMKQSKNGGPSKPQSGVIRSRTVPPGVVAHFVEKIRSLETHVDEVLQAEAVAKMDRLAEMELMKAQNLVEHGEEIMSRPQREWFATNKDKQNSKEAAKEKAKIIAEKVGTGTHRMTRKKRRAREAKEEMLRFQDEDREEAEETGRTAKRVVTDAAIKVTARAQKKELAEKGKGDNALSIHDEDVAVKRKKQKVEKKQKRKGAFADDAMGDSSLFDDEKIMHAPKKPSKGGEGEDRAKSTYDFKGFDPEKAGKKKPKIKSVKSFKSKAKYKRR
jgi:ATP-dependent RNA helicase DDX27